MAEDKIFLRDSAGDLKPVERQSVENEFALHVLVEQHPNLLAGDQINPDAPLRWMLVRSEAGVPREQDGADHFRLDLLLIDQDGVPTLTEVKRAENREIRRMIVGQMLDYAANAHEYWPVTRIRSLAIKTFGSEEQVNAEVLRLLAEEDAGQDRVEAFWHQVEENMQQGRMRLLFVADELPNELRQIIYFLNRHTRDHIEVLGVQIRQYLEDELEAYVPVVIGQSDATADKRKRSRRPILNLGGLREAATPEAFQLFSEVVREANGSPYFDVEWRKSGFLVRFDSSVVATETNEAVVLARAKGAHRHTSDRLQCDFFEVYTKPIPTQLREKAQEMFAEIPNIERAGDWSFRARLEHSSNIDDARALWNALRELAPDMTEQPA